jgi:hypothetical protein
MIKHYHDEFPELETRERMAGKVEVQCPMCARWRPSFCIVEVDGVWQCDADTTLSERSGGNE